MKKIKFSKLNKTWFIDIDGVIFLHNGYLHEKDGLVDGVKEFLDRISPNDYIILTSAREKKFLVKTKIMLKRHSIRYDQIIFDLPKGERILVNDIKPGGLRTAFAINTKRDKFPKIIFENDSIDS